MSVVATGIQIDVIDPPVIRIAIEASAHAIGIENETETATYEIDTAEAAGTFQAVVDPVVNAIAPKATSTQSAAPVTTPRKIYVVRWIPARI